MDFKWHKSKEKVLEKEKRPTFERVVSAIGNGGYIDEIENSNYPGQRVLVVRVVGVEHLCAVPFTKKGEIYFLHTVYPCRKLSKQYPGK